MIRGPKSRAGLNPAWVNGAIHAINAPTVKPIKGGITNPFVDDTSFFGFVNAKITKARMPVPIPSARNAVRVLTGELGLERKKKKKKNVL